MARENVNKRIAKLEKRVSNKLTRLKKKGVRVTSIDPRKKTGSMSVTEKRSYERRLERFMDTQYTAGKDGTPIDRAILQQIRYATKKTNEARAKRYKAERVQIGDTTFVKGKHGEYYGKKNELVNPLKMRQVETFTSMKHAREYLAKVHEWGSKAYLDARDEQLRKNVIAHADSLSDDADLQDIVKSLTVEELQELYAATNFVEWYFIDTPPKKKTAYSAALLASGMADPEDIAGAIEFESRDDILRDALRGLGYDV